MEGGNVVVGGGWDREVVGLEILEVPVVPEVTFRC